MIIIETILNTYTGIVLGTTSIIEAVTGLYPREQLAYVQAVNNLPESSGVMDTLIGKR